jgi:hypothetical protein
MSLIQVGLVDTTGKIDVDLMHAVAAALNVQVTRDLPQFWPVQATVRYLPHTTQLPVGVWPVQLVKQLPPGEGGFHINKHNQPYAKVIASPDSDEWTIDASHETIEMLVDPYGNKLQASQSIEIEGGKIQDGTGEFEYLVEACDPCEADKHAYPIQGVAVSDFITPRFYDPVATPGTRYSFTGAITAPRQILPGGYISFVNVEADEVQQILYVDPNSPPQLKNLGPSKGPSLRQWIDGQTHSVTRKKRHSNPALLEHCKQHRVNLERFARARVKFYPVEKPVKDHEKSHKGHA